MGKPICLRRPLGSGALLVILFISCDQSKFMELTVLHRRTLEGISAASGIETLDDRIYIIGDNIPWLYQLDDALQTTRKFRIASDSGMVDGVIPKGFKPDFEATAMTHWNGEPVLLVFGSGSKSPERDTMVRLNPVSGKGIRSWPMDQIYKAARKVAGLKKKDFNIEAAVATETDLYLFNRGKNQVFHYRLSEFFEMLETGTASPPAGVYPVRLPAIRGIRSGFSGATLVPGENRILFTASVENTENWIDDGQILGSFAGILDLGALAGNPAPECRQLQENGGPMAVKIESVAVQRVVPGAIHMVLVSDSDDGKSELLEAVWRH